MLKSHNVDGFVNYCPQLPVLPFKTRFPFARISSEMIINWYGGGCYKIATPDFAVIVDPDSSESGRRLKGDLIVKTESELENAVNNKEANLISGPGEYEFSGVKVRGYMDGSSNDRLSTAYKIVFEDIKFGFVPAGAADLVEEAADILSDADILFVAANEPGAKIAKRIAPKIVIPGEGNQKKFASDLGREPEPEEKLVIKRKDLDAVEGMKVVILNK